MFETIVFNKGDIIYTNTTFRLTNTYLSTMRLNKSGKQTKRVYP